MTGSLLNLACSTGWLRFILSGANPFKAAPAALEAILAAYAFSAKKGLLTQLPALNHEAAKSKRGEPLTAPGVPKIYSDAQKLVTEDRIKPRM